MQFTPLQLKEKLLGALDEDNNVVDAAVVLEVISILEKFPITREALEQTRIGRHVNELRKKTNNEELAKRAKKLVRGWQKFLTLQDNCNVNGDGVNTPPQHRNVSALQTAGNGSKPLSPALRSPALSGVVHARSSLSPAVSSGPVTPNSQPRSTLSNKPGSVSRVGTPELNKSSKLSPGLTKSLSTSNLKLPVTNPHQSVNIKPSLQSSRLSPSVSHSSPKLQNQAKFDAIGKHSKLYSPKIRPNSPCQSPQLTGTGRPITPVGNEDSLSSFPGTPTSIQSGSGQEAGNGHTKGKKHKTPPIKGGKVKVKKSNHSTESLISKKCELGSRSDQSNVSKTDIANRKRARLSHISDTPVKQQKVDSSVHSLSTKHPLNGKLYPTQSKEKTKHNAVVNNSATLESPKSCNSPIKEKSDIFTPSTKKFLAKQDSLKLASLGKTPKVKTTAELIAELQQKTGSASYGNVILEKLRTKQIEHEADVQGSVLPPGVKPRRKRKSNDSSYISVPSPSLSQTKTELVQHFLQTSLSPTSTDFSPHIDDFSVKAESPINSSQNAEESIIDTPKNKRLIPCKSVSEHLQQSSSRYSEVKGSLNGEESVPQEKRLTVDEIYSRLPPINLDSIDWESSDYVVPEEAASVTDTDVVRIHNDNWPSINGCFDRSGSWHDWASTLTLSSYDDNPLHILPYVIVDD